MQLSLFDHVAAAYAESPVPLSQERLYERISETAGIKPEDWAQTEETPSGATFSTLKRDVRWHQQTLKHAGLLENTGRRGHWTLTKTGRTKLRKVQPKASLVAFSTKLGVALWSLAEDVFSAIDTPITLCVTSPPYPLRRQRAYGDPTDKDYLDWLIDVIRPIQENLVPGGSICLNLGNDLFEPGSPARSLYRERLVIRLVDDLGLHLMDSIVWHNNSKPPSPTYWACVKPVQLAAKYETILWLTNDPAQVRSDNRQVLQPHSDRHKALMAAGGIKEAASYSDGAHRKRPGGFGKETPGRLPTNVISMGHRCQSQSRYKALARGAGLEAHGAPFPLALVKFLIRFLTRQGELVVDPFGGSLSTAVGAEELGRRWLTTEAIWEYNRGGGLRFDQPQWEQAFLRA
mgnify:CR=1 FL=1